MIGHYRQLLALRGEEHDSLEDHKGFGNRLTAIHGMHPFIIRFEDDKQPMVIVAYLSVVDCLPEWRYSQWDPGYLRCPVMQDPAAIAKLDGLFLRYYRKHRLPDALDQPQRPSGRLAWIDDWFFSGEEEMDHSTVIGEGIVGELYCSDGVFEFLAQLRGTLGVDRVLFRVDWVKAGKLGKRILSIRFGKQASFVDVAMAGNLYLHLLLTLNELLWPNHEIRRYRNGNTGQGGILAILSVKEWERLGQIRGREAVDRKFERIDAQAVVDIRTDHEGMDILAYDKILGL